MIILIAAMKMRLYPYLFMFLLVACNNPAPEPATEADKDLPTANFAGKVVKIVDGDTVDVLWLGKPIRVRLAHIDCPERGQPFYKKAKDFAGNLCFNKEVNVINKGQDRNQRIIGEIELPDGILMNEEMVRNGFAWHFVKYSDNERIHELETDARTARNGLWADASPTPPWEWRTKKKEN